MGIGKSQDECLGKFAPDEPFFILRADDPLAAEHVEAWAIEAELNGYPKARVAEAHAIAKAMRTWRETKKPRQSKSDKPRKTKPGRRRQA